MKLIGGLGGLVLGGIGKLLGVGAGKQQQVAALPAPTRDDAAAMVEREDRLRRRKGSASDMIVNGSSGAEPTSPVGRLVVGN